MPDRSVAIGGAISLEIANVLEAGKPLALLLNEHRFDKFLFSKLVAAVLAV